MEDVSISLKGYPGETFCLWQGFLFNSHFKTLLTLCWDKVSLSAFAFLFSELVQYNQTRVDNIAELERRLEDAGYAVGARVLELLCCWGLSDHLVLHPLDIEGVVEDSISSSWKSQGLALLQVKCYLMLHSMVVYLSRNLNLVLLKQGFVATLCTSFFNHDC
ncbi:hypothetical protein ES319_D02G113000v1 [Gossypium barbadense]|uniref:Uncharacterized protein n=3 Tax=Gossypium TaxID=3633 RepID=A0A5J5SB41_GOSBA|nr:hypothetical protein ES319_D02G113000v1 [Gossypium barbadense]KAB2040882.1 hypothetical protein ES319_D02G113000v1 [Gossypium barbadense]KAB2040883.1 hypothetical protein ES319_D02G113000v1 [Gossypium barbadense]TYG79187.1 hypothetical protein ES288_D02G120900v1 [Gossypium darwinii]TYG79188.1 hypothetical protein ES288_D02G120900v1 [Gossypium darwinii]